jgi:hypothetical protein
MIGLVMLGSIIDYLTRSTLSVAAPTLLKDLNISTEPYSWVVGTFQVAILQYNWQSTFVMTGALGLVWVAVWLWLYHPPEEHPTLSPTEFDYIAAGQEKHLRHDRTLPAVLSLLRRRCSRAAPLSGRSDLASTHN